MHKYLQHQLQQCFAGKALKDLPEELQAFIQAVNTAYEHADRDHAAAKQHSERQAGQIHALEKQINRLSFEAEKKQQREKRYEAAIKASESVLFDWNLNTRQCVYSGSTEEILGYATDDLNGHVHKLFRLAHPDDRKRIWDESKQLRSRKNHTDIEFRIKHKDGTYIDVQVSGRTLIDPLDGSYHSLGVVRDITERKQAADEVRRQKERAESYLAIAGTIIVAIDTNAKIILINRKGCETLGYKEEELIGKNWIDTVVPERTRTIHKKIFKRFIEGELNLLDNFENRIITKDGTLLNFNWHNSVLHDAAGNIVATLSSGEDITERKRLEESLVSAKEQADAANLAKSNFLATMSHEIRTPLNAILGMGDLLASGDFPEDQKKYVRVLQRNGRILLDLVNDILDFSRIESGRIELESVPFDLKELTTELIDAFMPQAEEKAIDLSLGIDEHIDPRRVGDPNRLRQMLINLIANAIKFTPHGYIRLTITPGEGEDQLLIDVSDTGIGIPRAQIENIFDAFSQADSSTTREYGGSGLGLSICKQFALLMDGDISVESTLGEGSVFHLRLELPIDASSLAEAENPDLAQTKLIYSSRLSGRHDKFRLLLAEDATDNIFVITTFLKEADVDIDVAENGAVAFERFTQNDYDLVLMDMQMPVMDGISSTRLIRQWEQDNHRNSTPILALTAHALSDDREKALQAGCDDHLLKPISRERLLKTIEHYAHNGS